MRDSHRREEQCDHNLHSFLAGFFVNHTLHKILLRRPKTTEESFESNRLLRNKKQHLSKYAQWSSSYIIVSTGLSDVMAKCNL